MSIILITGSSNGLGAAMVRSLEAYGHTVIGYDIEHGLDVRNPDVSVLEKRGIDKVDVLINNAGVNLIDWLEDVTDADWDAVMDINAKGIFKMTQAFLPYLLRGEGHGAVLNIVSNAAHMPMTSSLAYNASKGAAHIMTLQLARELTRKHGTTVFGVAPNKLKGTNMSDDIDEQVVRTRGWTKEYAHEYQIKAMLSGEETPPETVADFIAYLLMDKDHHKYLTGTIIPYGA
jgi:NAD(P)-dependent dehydrogenase (short-subunit alcohol dehydrogenase family)